MNMRTILTLLIVAIVLLVVLNRAMAALDSDLEEDVPGEDVPS
jgi:hypothetical protein